MAAVFPSVPRLAMCRQVCWGRAYSNGFYGRLPNTSRTTRTGEVARGRQQRRKSLHIKDSDAVLGVRGVIRIDRVLIVIFFLYIHLI